MIVGKHRAHQREPILPGGERHPLRQDAGIGQMRAIALQLCEGQLHPARLFEINGERQARAHDAIEAAPAEHGDNREHADGDQQFNQRHAPVAVLMTGWRRNCTRPAVLARNPRAFESIVQ